MARLAFPIALATAFLLAACGGGAGRSQGQAPMADEVGAVETTGRPILPEWTRRLLAARGPDVALVFSTSDYVPGRNRVGFLIVRNDGSLVTAPTAAVYVGSERGGVTGRATARLETIGTGGKHVVGEATRLYVADVPLPSPGRHWLVVEPKGEAIQAVGAADVHARPAAPGVGDRAIAVENPTLADAPATQITTADPPDTALLRYSVADLLARHEPFVVVFATPKFCQSRTCGPTVDVVDRVRRDLRDRGVRFVHIEIYKDNDPQKGLNQWVKAWHLPTEPWTFVVDRKGLIRARFEGSVGVRELKAAVRQSLL